MLKMQTVAAANGGAKLNHALGPLGQSCEFLHSAAATEVRKFKYSSSSELEVLADGRCVDVGYT